MALHTLQNPHWQVGILPKTGASIAFGRVRYSGTWVDILRPTAEADYANSSKCSSFIMLPWCNRIKDGLLRFNGAEYQLATTKDDGTARHGDVRSRAWQVQHADETHIRLTFDSRQHENINWPFAFSAAAEYQLQDRDFVLSLTLINEDTRPMPAGFGHHPYFVSPAGDNAPLVQIPCDQQFELTHFMATAAPIPVKPELDFRQMRALPPREINDLLTGRHGDAPAIIRYPRWNLQLTMHADPIFAHMLLYSLPSASFVALEPMTNASDGFNLYTDGIAGSCVFVLDAGESKSGLVRISIG